MQLLRKISTVLAVIMTVFYVSGQWHVPPIAWVVGVITGFIWNGGTHWLSILISNRSLYSKMKLRYLNFLTGAVMTIIYMALIFLLNSKTFSDSNIDWIDWVLLNILPAFAVIAFSDRKYVAITVDFLVKVALYPLLAICWALIIPHTQFEHWAPGLWFGFLFAGIAISNYLDMIFIKRSEMAGLSVSTKHI